MSFLLDTDTCSAHIRRPAGLVHRFIQHAGRLWMSAITLAELHAGEQMAGGSPRLLAGMQMYDWTWACCRLMSNVQWNSAACAAN